MAAKDDADIASEQEEFARAEALRQAGRYSPLPFLGLCYNCNEPSNGNFCDADCRGDWEKRERKWK